MRSDDISRSQNTPVFSLASKSITVSWNLTIYQSVANDRHLVAWCNICGCFTRQVVGCKNTPEKMYKHIFLLYFWSNKCSLGEHKRIFSKALKKSYWPQIFKLMCLYYIYIYILKLSLYLKQSHHMTSEWLQTDERESFNGMIKSSEWVNF